MRDPSSQLKNAPGTDLSERTTRPHSARTLALLFGLFFLAHVVFYIVMRPYYPEWAASVIPRNGWYSIAENVAAGHGFVLDHLLTYFKTENGTLVPTASRGPVPILWLAAHIVLFSKPYYPILITTWLLSAGSALLAYAIAWRLTKRRNVALMACLFSGLHLSEMWINTTFSYCSEPTFMFLFLAGLYITLRAADSGRIGWAVASGLCMGLACLARQHMIFMPAVYFVLFWLTQRTRFFRLAMVACAIFAAVQLPWVIRNTIAFGKPVVTSTLGGYGLFLAADRAVEPGDGLIYSWPNNRKLHAKMLQVLAGSGMSLNDVNERQFDTVLRARGWQIIFDNKRQYTMNCLSNAITILYRVNSGKGLYALQNALYYLLACVGIFVAWRQRLWRMTFPLAAIAYTILFFMPFVAQYRYFLPAAPLLFIFTALGVDWCWSLCLARRPLVAASHVEMAERHV